MIHCFVSQGIKSSHLDVNTKAPGRTFWEQVVNVDTVWIYKKRWIYGWIMSFRQFVEIGVEIWLFIFTFLLLFKDELSSSQNRNYESTGKYSSKALILLWTRTNPQYSKRLFIEWRVQYIHENSNLRTWWEHVVYTNCFLFLFWHTEQFMYTTCFVDTWISASEKNIPIKASNLKTIA